MTDDRPTPRYQAGDIIGETTEDGGRLDLVLAVGQEAYFIRHLGGLGGFDDMPNVEPLETAWGIEGCEAATYLHERAAATPAAQEQKVSAGGREHVWTGIIRDGHAYVTDEPDCADECLGIHNSPEGPVDCDGRPI